MSITHMEMKNWKAECPKCQHIEYSESSGGANCGNCNAPVKMTYGIAKNGWTDEAARQSWRQISCTKGCGWSVNHVTCSECGAKIRGDFFKGSTKWCFVATAAFNDEDHPTVDALREWRDDSLACSRFGSLFINYYYRIGEKLASKLNKYPVFKPMIRVILTVVTKIIK